SVRCVGGSSVQTHGRLDSGGLGALARSPSGGSQRLLRVGEIHGLDLQRRCTSLRGFFYVQLERQGEACTADHGLVPRRYGVEVGNSWTLPTAPSGDRNR